MKNKTVAQMYKSEFNLSDDIQVEVEFLMGGDSWEEYNVSWFEGDIHKQSIIKMPAQLKVETIEY